MGLSLTATSAVWVLLDTSSGTVLAEEVVAVTSVDEVAKAAAQSVQAFAAQTDHDIDSVHLTWTEDGRQHGIRLRTKLRLYGFDAIETITPDEAREGRNRTARHIAPHLAMAYGAARATHADDTGSALQRLTALVPHRSAEPGPVRDGVGARLAAVGDNARDSMARLVDTSRATLQSAGARVPLRIAAAVGVAAVVGVALYAFVGVSPTPAPAPEPASAVAEPTSAPSGDPEPAVPAPAPEPVLARPDVAGATQRDAGSSPESTIVAEAAPAVEAVPEVSTPRRSASVPVTPAVEDTAVANSAVENTAVAETSPQVSPVAEVASAPAQMAPAEQMPSPAGRPHLSNPAPVAGPIAVPEPSAPVAPAAPEPPPGPLNVFLGALP
ncbi:hypothetical protein [Mycolicibacterium duvalii]|nr:hypothetical protein [Mycolicibacterium duvalii]